MPFGNGTCNSTAAEYALSDQLKDAWTAMAAKGNPATAGLDWPSYDSCQGKGVFVQDTAVVAKLDFDECAFWGQVWAKLSGQDLPYLVKAASCTGKDGGS